ncbi:PREDICTED: uncharacterized protein LOC105359945 [Ceratosolen solmsi marchali]|uniref:Uncharacterized protein LOC105359945 n=1 Tax=Ceratosolen solmsi marchali TaxID=326594 RepID=A0AAJ6VMK2_9HYME|nr:PREDICTED: uncharacterized protein LOC105359945 [Ceratosolen solmsi marchali]
MNNNNAASRRPVGPVRQHSLPQPPRHQQQIRRQRSTEDENNPRIYSTNSVGYRNRCPGTSSNRQSPTLDRPRVRVAWSEQTLKPKNDGGVEIVARQIPTGKLTRSTNGRDNKSVAGRCPLRDRATILYSRQELAERLREAWRQREVNKSNIDIFLAHNTVEDRCDSVMSTETNPTVRSTSKLHKKSDQRTDGDHAQNVKLINETNNAKDKKSDGKSNEGPDFQKWFPSSTCNNVTTISTESQSPIVYNVAKADDIKERVEGRGDDDVKKNASTEKKSSININCHNWNIPRAMDNANTLSVHRGVKEEADYYKLLPKLSKEADYSQARMKRANYQSGLNKAFASRIIEKSSSSRVGGRNDRRHEESTRFRRTSSAPPRQRTRVDVVVEGPGMPLSMSNAEPEGWITAANEQSQSAVKGPILDTNRPIKSAPAVKRRTKTNKRRGPSVAYSKDGEEDETVLDNARGKARNVKKTGKSRLAPRNTDVVTMVSLVSSADSDSEMDEISSRDDKLICELRNKLPTTPIIKSSNGLSTAIRKPFKSEYPYLWKIKSLYYISKHELLTKLKQNDYEVFVNTSTDRDDSALQADAAVREDTRTSLRRRFITLSKSNVIGNATVVGPTSHTISPLPTPWRTATLVPFHVERILGPAEVTLTDREKRCLAVPIVDISDKKRKLLRCRSAVAAPKSNNTEKQLSDTNQPYLQAEMRMPQMISRASLLLQESNPLKVITNPSALTLDRNVEKNKKLPAESYCQTPKEKECWHLYQRMCDKGVFVSFDTVLRGMLTPTEYRLRQKEMSQNC